MSEWIGSFYMGNYTQNYTLIKLYTSSGYFLDRTKWLWFVLEPWLWFPLHQSHCVANCLLFQDTVIALQALAAYGEATYNSITQNVVKITSEKPFEKVFTVNNENRLLLQQTPLPEVPGKYNLTVNGTGCVLMQVSVCPSLRCVPHSACHTAMFLMTLHLISLYFS